MYNSKHKIYKTKGVLFLCEDQNILGIYKLRLKTKQNSNNKSMQMAEGLIKQIHQTNQINGIKKQNENETRGMPHLPRKFSMCHQMRFGLVPEKGENSFPSFCF